MPLNFNQFDFAEIKVRISKSFFVLRSSSERDLGDLERQKADLKADIADLKKEHRRRYNALQTLADQHRSVIIFNNKKIYLVTWKASSRDSLEVK